MICFRLPRDASVFNSLLLGAAKGVSWLFYIYINSLTIIFPYINNFPKKHPSSFPLYIPTIKTSQVDIVLDWFMTTEPIGKIGLLFPIFILQFII